MAWVASLGPKVQPKTIKGYLTHVHSLHVDADLPFTATEAPIVQRLIRGIKRYHGERERNLKLPITITVLCQLLKQLRPSEEPAHRTLYAACCLAFSALLRCGEFTISGSGKFNPEIHLSRGSISFIPDLESATHILLALPASKTDPFRKGISITVAAAPGSPSCPIRALQDLFLSTPDLPPSSPLFITPEGDPLTRKYFIGSLRQYLTAAGFEASKYSGHSFRRGGASSAAAAGFNDYEIQLLGHWRSDTYKLYIEVLPVCILQLSSRLH